MDSETKQKKSIETKLKRIAERSKGDQRAEFKYLMPLFNKENLISCFHELDGKKAVGVDGKSKGDYAINLEENVEKLISRMKSFSYRPLPVREVLIPKSGGKKRPLGISVIEDKTVQLLYSKILEAIYEPIFINESFGFRRGRSCHDAIKKLREDLNKGRTEVVIDVDLRNFFGTIDHKKLMAILELKIKDRTFLRYIVRMLKSGVLSGGELCKTMEGTPQGSIVSPILANVFAHYAIDIWFKNEVRSSVRKQTYLNRYCDDMVICCSKEDGERITKSLEGRLGRFSLELNDEKTRIASFSIADAARGIRQGTFDYLGFTFFIGETRNGHKVVKLKTSSKRLRSKLKTVKEWCRSNRHKMKLGKLWDIFRAKLRGHIRYYGVSFNSREVTSFLSGAERYFFKWINRRSQRKSLTWDQFRLLKKKFPLPKVRVYHYLF